MTEPAPSPATRSPETDASGTRPGPAHLHMVRVGQAVPTSFLIMGERSSGTNLLTATMRRTFGLKLHGRDTFWKHGFPTFPALPGDCVVIGVTRRADAWVRSMYAKPWHATNAMRALGFSDFLRAQWNTIVDNRFMHKAYRESALSRRPLQFDRHPLTGQAFENIFQMRTAKLQALRGMLNRRVNVALVPLETVLADPPAYLAAIAEQFDLAPPAEPKLPEKRMGGADSWGHRTVTPPADLSDEDWAFMVSQLDGELEAFFGYSYDR